MLHLIPAGLHRTALRVAHAIRRRWWRLARVRLNGCRVLAFDPQGRILLIRHSYGSGNWMLPGGGIGRNEAPLDAGVRELREETGCALKGARVHIVVEEPLYGTINRVHVIVGLVQDDPRCDGREVIAARLVAQDELPENLSPVLKGRMAEWFAVFGTLTRPG